MDEAIQIWRAALQRAKDGGEAVEVRLQLAGHRDRFLAAWPSGLIRLLQKPEPLTEALYGRLDRLLREGWRVTATRPLPAQHAPRLAPTCCRASSAARTRTPGACLVSSRRGRGLH